MQWLNFTTFDIIGDLTFDESFDFLENENYNAWIANLYNMLRKGTSLCEYPIIGVPVMSLRSAIPTLARANHRHQNFTREMLTRRLNSKTERKDFMRLASSDPLKWIHG